MPLILCTTVAALIAGCGVEPAPPAWPLAGAGDPTAAPPARAISAPETALAASQPPVVAKARSPLIGETLARAQWARAENRDACAPLGLAGDGGRGGTVRRADFSGGWGVAFDLPGVRSAYGFAGPDLVAADQADPAEQRMRLSSQWPYFRDLPGLPEPAFAGYGLVGAEPYPESQPDGAGLHSLAYVRVGGQSCTYNVWSRISRAHLETLLDNLRLLR